MKVFQRRFVLQLLAISIVLYGILYAVFSKLMVAAMPLTAMLSLLFAINSLAFIIVTNTKEKKPKSFVYSYMTVSLGRLIICSIFVFSYALMHRQDAKTFGVTFFLLYFLYTVIEVRSIYGFFKQ